MHVLCIQWSSSGDMGFRTQETSTGVCTCQYYNINAIKLVRSSTPKAQESQQSEQDRSTINFQTITIIFEERINKDTTSGEKIFKG